MSRPLSKQIPQGGTQVGPVTTQTPKAFGACPDAPAPQTPDSYRGRRIICLLLMALTLAVFWTAKDNDFIYFDDQAYVTENPHVLGGLSWEGVKWAFSNPVCSNWHPVTVLSHMLDCEVFGANPQGHHLVNVLLHAVNAALVFALLHQMTGAVWRSLFVAAFFAVHPLRVESVAWVAERKDVLSGLFFFLTLWAYLKYARGERRGAGEKSEIIPPSGTKSETNPKSQNQDAKSEVQDSTPINREQGFKVQGSRSSRSIFHLPFSIFYLLALLLFALGLMSKPMVVTLPFVLLLLDYWPLQRFQLPVWWRLVWEKVPFFALAAGGSVVTFQVQKHTGAVITVETLQVGERAGNALISYCRYLDKLFWPTDLAVYYPHPRHWPVEKLLLAIGLLLAIWGAVYVLRRRWPFLLMGWVWFVGMLVPVLGLVQVGSQALADRYTYLPSLGILILVIWGGYELIPERFRGWSGAPKAFGAAGSAAILLCAVLTRQQIAYWKDTEALFRHAIEVTKDNAFALNNLGYALINKGQYTEAINHYQEAIHLKPDDAQFRNNLGVALLGIGRASEAINELQKAIRLQPSYANAHNNLGSALAKKGRWDEAIVEHERALELQPNDMGSQNNLAWLLATCPQANLRNGAKAVELAEAASRSRNGTGWDYLDTLAATYAEAGQFPQAVEAGSRALALAVRRTNAPVAEIRARLKLYEAGLPYHETAP